MLDGASDPGGGGLDPRPPALADGVGAGDRRTSIGTTSGNRRETFIPLDVAGYVAADGQGKPVDRHVAVWVERAGPDDQAWLYAGATPDDHETIRARLALEKLLPRPQAALGADGRTRYSGVWGRSPSTTTTWWTNGIEWEDAYRKDTKTVEVERVWAAGENASHGCESNQN